MCVCTHVWVYRGGHEFSGMVRGPLDKFERMTVDRNDSNIIDSDMKFSKKKETTKKILQQHLEYVYSSLLVGYKTLRLLLQ